MAMQIIPQRREWRVADDLSLRSFLYPREVVHALGVSHIDYHQLRRLLALVRGTERPTLDPGWAKYSLADVAGLRIALLLCGAYDPADRRRYLRISALEKACSALRELGFSNPLIEVPMVRHGKQIIAEVRGLLVNPESGQLVLGEARDLLVDAIAGLPGEAEAVATLSRELEVARASLGNPIDSLPHLPPASISVVLGTTGSQLDTRQ